MCNEKKRPVQTDEQPHASPPCTCHENQREYLRLSNAKHDKKSKEEQNPRLKEKLVFVTSVFAIVFVSNVVISFPWILPWLYGCATPLIIITKTVCYWKNKWQFFMIDFCYTANTLLMIYLSMPQNENMFRLVFALSNGPLLMAAVVYKNSLVFHDFDKITSGYIHLLPALVTLSARWAPSEMSFLWHTSFVQTAPQFDVIWLYVVPFGCFFLHSCCYCLIVNVIVRPEEPYLTSYRYLAVKYEKLKVLKGPIGHAILYYGLNWLFCLCSLGMALLCYWSFIAHCIIVTAVVSVVTYNGASYYMDVFCRRGFWTKG